MNTLVKSRLEKNLAIKNTTRKANIEKLLILANKELEETDKVEKTDLVNVGTIAELVIYKFLKNHTSNKIERHENIKNPFDIYINGEKVEIKSCLNGDSNKVAENYPIYALTINGLYYIPTKAIKLYNLKGKKVKSSLVALKKFITLKYSWEELLKA